MRATLALFALAFSSLALADGSSYWYPGPNLKAQDGTAISIVYSTHKAWTGSNKPGFYEVLSGLRISVSNPSLKATDRVRAVLVNRMKNHGYCGAQAYDWQEVGQVDLTPMGQGIFGADFIGQGFIQDSSGQFSMPITQFFLVDAPYCHSQVSYGQELAIVVNDQWLPTDLNPSSHNFLIDLASDISKQYRK